MNSIFITLTLFTSAGHTLLIKKTDIKSVRATDCQYFSDTLTKIKLTPCSTVIESDGTNYEVYETVKEILVLINKETE